MSNRTEIERKTGASKNQLRCWTSFGLLLSPQQHGAGRGSVAEWSNDTEERVRIIKECVKEGRKLLEIGHELFLLGYILHPKLTRKVLLKQLDDEDKALQGRMHTPLLYKKNLASEYEPTEEDEAKEKQRISRSLKPKTAVLSTPVQTSIREIAYTMNGLRPITIKGETLDYPSQEILHRDIQSSSDEAILQADMDTLAYLHSTEGASELEKWEHDLGVSAEQAAKHRLSLHTCKYPHTHAQAWRPLLTMLALCPLWDTAIAEKDERLARPLVINMVRELRNKGK